MATFEITDPQTGKTITLEGDSPPTEKELNDIFSSVHGSAIPGGQSISERPPSLLSYPERKSREGINMMYGALEKKFPPVEPTGNLMRDVVSNMPNILASSEREAASQIIPSAVSPLSLAMMAAGPLAGAISKGAKSMGPLAANLISKTSGISPQALEEAAGDAMTVFKPGIEKANQIYKGLKKSVPVGETPDVSGMEKTLGEKMTAAFNKIKAAATGEGSVANASPRRMVDNALTLAREGKLSPRLANSARQALDSLYGSKSIPKDFFNAARETLKSVENESQALKTANTVRSTAENVDQLRNPFPITKSGGTGQFRTMAIGAGAATHPALAPVLSTLFSPAVQGGEAAAAGLAVRKILDPIAKSKLALRALLGAALSQRRKPNAK